MLNKDIEKLWHSKCLRDSKSEHFWEKLGVVQDETRFMVRTYLIWRCSQCQKCLYEELEFLEEDESLKQKRGKK